MDKELNGQARREDAAGQAVPAGVPEQDVLDEGMLAGFLGVEPGEAAGGTADTAAATLARYRDVMERGAILKDVRFTQLEKSSGMWFYDGEVRVFMPATEHLCYRPDDPSAAFVAPRFIERPYNVLVTAVDEALCTVTVSYYEAQQKFRRPFERQIRASLAKGVPFRTKAIVNHIEYRRNDLGDPIKQDKIQLSVGGVGTNGYMWLGDWSEGYVPSFEFVVRKGDVIDVAVTEVLDSRKYKDHQGFKCSRKLVEPSPWTRLSDRIAMYSVVEVVCAEEPDSRHPNFFWGMMEGTRDVFFPCFLPKKQQMRVRKGCRYYGTVTAFDPAARTLRVTVRPEPSAEA